MLLFPFVKDLLYVLGSGPKHKNSVTHLFLLLAMAPPAKWVVRKTGLTALVSKGMLLRERKQRIQ